MAIVAGDIDYFLSGDGTPAGSLGGAITATEVTIDTLFDDVSSAEASAGDTEYRCIYVKNNTAGGLTLQGAKVFIQANTTGNRIDIAVHSGGKNTTAETEADESTAPTSIAAAFAQPADYASGLSLGDLAPTDYCAIWVRRTIPASAGAATDTFTLRVQGETNP